MPPSLPHSPGNQAINQAAVYGQLRRCSETESVHTSNRGERGRLMNTHLCPLNMSDTRIVSTDYSLLPWRLQLHPYNICTCVYVHVYTCTLAVQSTDVLVHHTPIHVHCASRMLKSLNLHITWYNNVRRNSGLPLLCTGNSDTH